MKKVFETMSDMIIPGLIFVSIVVVIAGGALFTRVGQRMDVEGDDFSNCIDTGAVENVCAREQPTIKCVGKKNWGVGETIQIDSIFLATDTEGNQISVRLKDITDETGTSVMDRYKESDKTASFQRRGIYTFHLSAIDGERKEAAIKTALVVDGR